MNEKAIVKHFQARWANETQILAGRCGDWYLAAEGYVLLRLPLDHLLFDSRRLIPRFPNDGESLAFMQGAEPMVRETHLANIFADWWRDPELERVEATNWLKEHGGTLYRAFKFDDGQRVFVNEDFVTMLVGKGESLEGYEFYSKPLPQGDDTPVAAVIAHLDGEAVAALMPMRIYEQGPLFPIK